MSCGCAAKFPRTIPSARGKRPEDCDPKGDPDCIVARRRLRYVPHARLPLPIALRAACLGVPCDEKTTCVLGACVSAEFDDPARAGDLDAASTYDGTVPPPRDADAGADADATGGRPDGAALDAALDAGAPPCPNKFIELDVVSADRTQLAATPGHVFWLSSDAIYDYDVAAASTIRFPLSQRVARIAAADSTVFFSYIGSPTNLWAIDVSKSLSPSTVATAFTRGIPPPAPAPTPRSAPTRAEPQSAKARAKNRAGLRASNRAAYFAGGGAAEPPLATLAFLSPEWPWNVRVGANSPSLCPTMFSVTNTGTNFRPL